MNRELQAWAIHLKFQYKTICASPLFKHLWNLPQNISKGFCVTGFRPAAEVLLFRQKDPKPFLPCRGPMGSLRGSPTRAAAQLATLRQCSP